MFTITFETTYKQDFSCDFLFEKKNDAHDYLKSKGYTEKNGMFVKPPTGWNGECRAFVNFRAIYKPYDHKAR